MIAAFGTFSSIIQGLSTELFKRLYAVSGVLVMNTWAKVAPGTFVFVTAPPFVTTFFSVTVFVNVYCTCKSQPSYSYILFPNILE